MSRVIQPINLSVVLILLFFSLIAILPGLLNTDYILGRNNDLQEFFWPLFHYSKTQLLNHHTFPLWNNLILSGYPLIADPQAPLFYLPNLIFLILPIDLSFLISIIFHIFFGGLGIYLCSRKIFNYSKKISLFLGIIYICTPRLAAFIEAGHVGQIFSYAWIPFVILSTYKIYQFPNLKWVILLTLSLAGLFFTHSITFLVILFSSIFFFLILNILKLKISSINKGFYYALSLLLTFSLSSVALLPQIEWSSNTTRTLLFNKPEVYPIWNSFKEFFFLSLNPILLTENISSVDTEKWIPIGIILAIISTIGFWFLKLKYKVLIGTVGILTILLTANNLSPFYEILLKQNWYVLFRVTTRLWIIIILIAIFLTGYGLENLFRKKFPIFFTFSLAIFLLLELIFLSWTKIGSPIQKSDNLVPIEVYQFISNDKDQFRVFCTTKCLSQKYQAIYKIETIEGYNTLVQLNYYKHSWELTKSFWDYYSLSIPPLGIISFEKIQPSAKSLGEYNVKYVLSPHLLKDQNFKLITKIDKFYIYKNDKFLSRAYLLDNSNHALRVIHYSPNNISIETPEKTNSKVILADVYSKGWRAYLNGSSETEVLETPNSLRLVNISQDTRFVEFKFQPKSFHIGSVISISSLILIFLLLLRSFKND